jgi:hypothetical protein
MAININHPTNTIASTDALTFSSDSGQNITFVPSSGVVSITGKLTMSATPTGTSDLVTKQYVDDAVSGVGDTGLITFDGIKIIGAGTAGEFGDGTIELVPDNALYSSGQYIIVDPTAPNHIHLKAGSTSNDLFLGTDTNSVQVGGSYVNINAKTALGTQQTWQFDSNGDVTLPANGLFKNSLGNNYFATVATSGDYDDLSNKLTAGTGINIVTGQISSTITQYTNTDARGAISVTSSTGDGSLAYDNSNGQFTYTGPGASDYRAAFSAGTGVTITGGSIAIGQGVEITDNVTFNDLTVSGNLTVNGTTTSVNSTTVDIADKNLTLAKGALDSAAANGAGITIDGANATITYVHGTTSFDINKPLNVTGAVSSSSFIVTGSTSGQTTIQAAAIASGTLTLPASTGTLALTTDIPSLATVATTGDYDDLINKPTLVTDLNSLSNVSITSLSNGQVLKYNGTFWVNDTDNGITLSSLSVTSSTGDGSLAYDNSNGQFTYTGPGASDYRAAFSAGSGINISVSGEISSTITQYTDSDAQGAISVTSSTGDGSLSYNSSNGQFTYTGPGVSDYRAAFSAGSGINISVSGEISSTITQYTDTDADARISAASIDDLNDVIIGTPSAGQILTYDGVSWVNGTGLSLSSLSVTSSTGDGSLSYDNSNGQFTYTGPGVSDYRAAFSGGTGVTITAGSIAIGQEVGTTDTVSFAGLSTTGNVTVGGNLTVSGTTTTINSTNTNLQDNIITLNKGETGPGVTAGTAGIEIDRGTGQDLATFKWNESTSRWESRLGSNLTAFASSNVTAGNINITSNTVSASNSDGDLNLAANGTGKVKINNKEVATTDDAIAYAIVFGG